MPPYICRGLGVRPIKDVNTALLSKWLWRLGTDDESLWKVILTCKYRLGDFGRDVNPALRRASDMWQVVATCVDKFKERKAGRGDRIKFSIKF